MNLSWGHMAQLAHDGTKTQFMNDHWIALLCLAQGQEHKIYILKKYLMFWIYVKSHSQYANFIGCDNFVNKKS